MRRLLFTLALLLLPMSAWAQSPIVSGNLTSATCPGSGCLTLSVNGMGAASVQLAGTFSGTVQFESTVDGITYSALLMTKATDASTATSSTGVGVWSAWVGGQSIVRARVSSYASGTVRATIGGALGLAAPGLSGVILGNGVQPATAVALSGVTTQFFDGAGAWAVPALATPGGSNHQVQYDNAGVFGGISNGTSGWVLTSGGATATPSFQAAPNPFNQDLNSTDSPTFDVLTVTSCTGCGGGGVPSGWTWDASALTNAADSGIKLAGNGGFDIDGATTLLWLETQDSSQAIIFTNSTVMTPLTGATIMGVAVDGTFGIYPDFDLVGVGSLTFQLGQGWRVDGNGVVGLYIQDAWVDFNPNPAPNAAMGVGRVFSDTSGGKMRLGVLFPTGAAQYFAAEPGGDGVSYTTGVRATGFTVSGLTTPTNKPVCFDAFGNLYAGTNTAGVLSCP